MTVGVPDVVARIRRVVADLPPASAAASAHHFGWVEPGAAPIGKMLRARLALTSAAAAGASRSDAVTAAVAVELVHNFSLLHDDVMDGDRMRRNRPAAWTIAGTSVATLAGTALLVEAVGLLQASSAAGASAATARLIRQTRRLIRGQDADLRFETQSRTGIDECLTMAADKTSSLIACACALGAELSGAPPDLVVALDEFGEHLGLAYQLVNDLMDLWGDVRDLGRPRFSDIRAGKKSLPIVAALNGDSSYAVRLRACYAGTAALDDDGCRAVVELAEKAGGRAWAEREVADHAAVAADRLRDMPVPPAVRIDFTRILGRIAGHEPL